MEVESFPLEYEARRELDGAPALRAQIGPGQHAWRWPE
jgi:hypothetical protein